MWERKSTSATVSPLVTCLCSSEESSTHTGIFLTLIAQKKNNDTWHMKKGGVVGEQKVQWEGRLEGTRGCMCPKYLVCECMKLGKNTLEKRKWLENGKKKMISWLYWRDHTLEPSSFYFYVGRQTSYLKTYAFVQITALYIFYQSSFLPHTLYKLHREFKSTDEWIPVQLKILILWVGWRRFS